MRATREAVGAHVEELVALDALLLAEQGDRYTEEPWTAHSFSVERPLKFELSLLGLQDILVCGFVIASQTGEADVHIHRFGVHPATRGSGLAEALAEDLHGLARAVGARRITLYVSQHNEVARRFYKRVGYAPVMLHGRPGMERFV